MSKKFGGSLPLSRCFEIRNKTIFVRISFVWMITVKQKLEWKLPLTNDKFIALNDLPETLLSCIPLISFTGLYFTRVDNYRTRIALFKVGIIDDEYWAMMSNSLKTSLEMYPEYVDKYEINFRKKGITSSEALRLTITATWLYIIKDFMNKWGERVLPTAFMSIKNINTSHNFPLTNYKTFHKWTTRMLRSSIVKELLESRRQHH